MTMINKIDSADYAENKSIYERMAEILDVLDTENTWYVEPADGDIPGIYYLDNMGTHVRCSDEYDDDDDYYAAQDMGDMLATALDRAANCEQDERVIFDNGGGVTVQIHGWAHYYQDEAQAAADVAEWLKTKSTSGWDGHDVGALACDPSNEDTRNGGYRTWEIHQAPFGDEFDGEFPIDSWGNTSDFFGALIRLIG